MDGSIVCMDRTGKLYLTDTPHPDDVTLLFPSDELKSVLGSSVERLDKDVAEGLITKLKNVALLGTIALGILAGFFFSAPSAKASELRMLNIAEQFSVSVGVDKTSHLPNKFILLFSGNF